MLEKGFIAEETLSRDISKFLKERGYEGNMEIKSNEGRKILQKMSEESLVVPAKQRIEGAVLHTWKLNRDSLKYFVISRLRKAIEKLEARLRFEEENVIYVCPTCGRRYTFDDAYANEFTCRYDRTLLVEANKDEFIRAIKDAISVLQAFLKKVERT